MGLAGGRVRGQRVCPCLCVSVSRCYSERCLSLSTVVESGWGVDVRKLSVVLHLVLEVSQLCDDLFALFCPRGLGALRDGAVGIVDGLRLGGRREAVSGATLKEE